MKNHCFKTDLFTKNYSLYYYYVLLIILLISFRNTFAFNYRFNENNTHWRFNKSDTWTINTDNIQSLSEYFQTDTHEVFEINDPEIISVYLSDFLRKESIIYYPLKNGVSLIADTQNFINFKISFWKKRDDRNSYLLEIERISGNFIQFYEVRNKILNYINLEEIINYSNINGLKLRPLEENEDFRSNIYDFFEDFISNTLNSDILNETLNGLTHLEFITNPDSAYNENDQRPTFASYQVLPTNFFEVEMSSSKIFDFLKQIIIKKGRIINTDFSDKLEVQESYYRLALKIIFNSIQNKIANNQDNRKKYGPSFWSWIFPILIEEVHSLETNGFNAHIADLALKLMNSIIILEGHSILDKQNLLISSEQDMNIKILDIPFNYGKVKYKSLENTARKLSVSIFGYDVFLTRELGLSVNN